MSQTLVSLGYLTVQIFTLAAFVFSPLFPSGFRKVATLKKLWYEYDSLATARGLYKVETIGDAYLGVSGCPGESTSGNAAADAVHFALAALDILEMIDKFTTANGEKIQVRIGLHSGPVTAGILGELNPHWCIAGDTNTASRMESSSQAMRIRISEPTYNRIKYLHDFIFSEPEVMELKDEENKLVTYWILRRH